MTDKLPKRNDGEAMVRWMHRKLDELQQAEHNEGKGSAARSARGSAWLKADGPEIESAEWGDIEPLRKKYPRLAPFLVALTKSERKKHTKATRDDAIATAVWAYKAIPAIFKEHDVRNNRRRGEISTLEIAARWMNVAQKDILTRMNKSGPSGPSGKSRKKL